MGSVVMEKADEHEVASRVGSAEGNSSFSGRVSSDKSTESCSPGLGPTPPEMLRQSSMQTVFKGAMGAAVPKLAESKPVKNTPTRTTVCCGVLLMWLCCIVIEGDDDGA